MCMKKCLCFFFFFLFLFISLLFYYLWYPIISVIVLIIHVPSLWDLLSVMPVESFYPLTVSILCLRPSRRSHCLLHGRSFFLTQRGAVTKVFPVCQFLIFLCCSVRIFLSVTYSLLKFLLKKNIQKYLFKNANMQYNWKCCQ